MFFNGIAIRHPGDVVAYRSFQAALLDKSLRRVGEHQWLGTIGIEKIRYDPFGFDLHSDHAEMAIQFFIQKILDFAVASLDFLAVANDIVFQFLNIL